MERVNHNAPRLDVDKAAIIHGIYSGVYSVTKLPKTLYKATAEALLEAVYKGYNPPVKKHIKNAAPKKEKKKLSDFDFMFDSPDYEMLTELRTNIFMFAAAKTFQQTNEMSDALVSDEGEILSFADFKEAAGEIFDRYNEDWLEAEYNTAIEASRSAAKWVDVQADKETVPYLRYSAVMDEHTCEICGSLDDITLPVDDGFWDENTPPNHFNCECTVEQLAEDDLAEVGGLSDEDEVQEAVETSQENKNPLFNFNPGKDKEVFQDTGKDKHPYFDVSAKYRELAEANFNLPIPEND